ncbi:MAG: cation-translocating P-type ATPase [Syntrophales bacterium]|jgi:Ca2+-transporting ATPase|nr:cation-translocating P-type ATPase [Syntrophales bacterium]MDY0044069.1 cation-translocating P-type ATPase [Syntrophales bacterium]
MHNDRHIWHIKGAEEIFSFFDSAPQGIGRQEAADRLGRYGKNELVEKKKKSPLMMMIDQFSDLMIIILIAAAVISGIIGEMSDTFAIIIIVVINAIIGFIQEFRAEKAMEALKKMAGASAVVIREGMPASIPVSEVVPGDVLALEAGQIVPADMRIIESAALQVEEAALTGESVPVEKKPDILADATLPLGDRKNMAYKGTYVVYGRGSGIATATGMETELGKIASMLQQEEEVKTPLQKRLARFSQKLAVAVIVICIIVFAAGIMRGEEPLLMLLTAISLAVAAIPEALPAVITISLALGAKKLAAQNSLIRKLPAVETLGSVTYICSDKTGTLTLNKMTVEEIYFDREVNRGRFIIDSYKKSEGTFDPESPSGYLMAGLALSNDARADTDGTILGDPTETALFAIAEAAGFNKKELELNFPRIAELPFDSERKCMTTFHSWGASRKVISFTKGAPDVLFDRAVSIATSRGEMPLNKGELEKINEVMASEGMRVLCLCMRKWDRLPGLLDPSNVETELMVLGLIGMMDPPREEAKKAVGLCKTAGIIPVMITGDHPSTARTISRRLGILDQERMKVITGSELDDLTLEKFEAEVEQISVYARVAPEQKLKIVKALQDKGQFVAMTGDGVNDAPALKRADIGVAMGITGTDVSKQVAHMILLDDNFATIINAVKEGRRIFDNIRKFIKYTMTSNSGEIWTIFLAPILGLPIPLLPIHILWINLVTDGLPGLALAAEPAEKGVMQKPPRHPKESIFAHGMAAHIIWVGLLMGMSSIFMQAWSLRTGHAHWQTMVFTVLCLSQMGHVLAIRSEKESLFSQGLFTNLPLLGAFLLTFVLQLATIYVPFLNPVFKTEQLTLKELAFTIFIASIVFIAVEIEKLIKRKR